MSLPRKKLSDLLGAGGRAKLTQTWDSTRAAAEYSPLPRGEYVAVAIHGDVIESQHGTPGYRVTFEVAEGEFRGRHVRSTLWLTEAALPITKRELAKCGISNPAQLDQPLPVTRCSIRVALREGDDGESFNVVRSFHALGPEPPDPFAPGQPAADREPQA